MNKLAPKASPPNTLILQVLNVWNWGRQKHSGPDSCKCPPRFSIGRIPGLQLELYLICHIISSPSQESALMTGYRDPCFSHLRNPSPWVQGNSIFKYCSESVHPSFHLSNIYLKWQSCIIHISTHIFSLLKHCINSNILFFCAIDFIRIPEEGL